MKDTIGWGMLLSLILEDIEAMERRESKRNYMLDEIDEHFKGKAVNGCGVCIDFDEIRKAETYNDLAEMSKRLSDKRKEDADE